MRKLTSCTSKWQPEVDIFSLSVLWLDKFIQQELKQKHSDSLCETKVFHQARHQTSSCHSWSLGLQTHCFSSLLTVWRKLWVSQVWSLRAVKVLRLHLKELFSPGCKFDISHPSRINFVSKIKVIFFSSILPLAITMKDRLNPQKFFWIKHWFF